VILTRFHDELPRVPEELTAGPVAVGLLPLPIGLGIEAVASLLFCKETQRVAIDLAGGDALAALRLA
jgi:hypothetical protein